MAETHELEHIIGGNTSTVDLVELTTPATADRFFIWDASASLNARLKYVLLSTYYTYFKGLLDTAYDLVYVRKDMSNVTASVPIPQTLTDGGNTGALYNANLGIAIANKAIVTNNFTLSYTNAKIGYYIFIFTIGGAGSYTMTLNATSFKYTSGSAPVLSTSVGYVDVMNCFYDGTHMHVIGLSKNMIAS